jgi:hypothetical protein
MSFPLLSILSILILLMISQNMANPFNRAKRHHNKYDVSHCPDGQNCHKRRTVELESLQFWNCDFSLNDCGIHNQHNMDSYFIHLSNKSVPVFGKKGLLYLSASKARSSGARLITPYFPTNGCRYGCLTVEYLICGNGIRNLYLIQQDVSNYCVLQRDNDYSNSWKESHLTIDLTRSNPRFFIEVHFNKSQNSFGFIAISNLRFEYESCQRDETNACHLNRFRDSLF